MRQLQSLTCVTNEVTKSSSRIITMTQRRPVVIASHQNIEIMLPFLFLEFRRNIWAQFQGKNEAQVAPCWSPRGGAYCDVRASETEAPDIKLARLKGQHSSGNQYCIVGVELCFGRLASHFKSLMRRCFRGGGCDVGTTPIVGLAIIAVSMIPRSESIFLVRNQSF
jgi:hypothetical protein